ncbi:hypothetical protein NQ318_005265 [Aromia moschata]|uniref:Endonuclease/exonuclease/phosphatase domain-containing protein n=1 Tax=Aromia moschata TaxID=1265417 RepID=A0AAV8Y270_9CUCU|nr:hypothetical protein NQ318_005265 [Aromia moschata]
MESELEFKVFALNCWGLAVVSKNRKERIQAIAEILAVSQYDVVCLQEVWTDYDYNLIRNKVAGVLPFSHYFYSGVTGSGVCILSRHPIQETFFHQWSVNGYIHKLHHGDWFGGKGVGLCKFTVKDFNINVYSAHLHAEYDRECDEYQTHRILQAYDTAQFIMLTSGGADLVVLAGDLNTEPGDLAYRVILKVPGLLDAFAEATDVPKDMIATNESLKNSYTPLRLVKKNVLGKRIDYIMYHPGSKIQVDLKKYRLPLPDRVPNYNFSYSDHEAIEATLIVHKKEVSVHSRDAEQKKLVLEESVVVLDEALRRLISHKIVYFLISLFLFRSVTILMVFAILMATIWNKIEKHAVLAGKFAMEVTLKSSNGLCGNTCMMNVRICRVLFLVLFIACGCPAQDLDDEVTVETEETSPDVPYESPKVSNPNSVYFAEHFDDPNRFEKNWIRSQAKKEGLDEEIAKYDGLWGVEPPRKDGLPGDKGLVLKSKAKHAAISSPLLRPFLFDKKPLVVQYEVLLQDGQECGGAYLKLLSQDASSKNLNTFHDKTPYTIMFGPDKCGNDHKLHFIFRHKNPLNGSLEEKHCQKPKERLEEIFSDKLPHLYTLVLRPDNTFEISVDRNVINSGSLLEDFVPPVNPPQEIDDPNDKKPEDWDEREKIPDPEATKPDDWDEDAPPQIVDETAVVPDGWLEHEPTHVPDRDAVKPEDWDSDMDGEWEPPLIENPACASVPGCGAWEPPLINNPAFKGKWRPPMIDNPNYKGKWRPRKIPNPDFFEDKQPFKMTTVLAVGFELWSMSKDILFDNILITDEIAVAEKWAADTFDKKRQKIARDSESLIQKLANVTNDYPALWGLYIIVLAIPVVFVLYLCCKPSSSASQTQEKEELAQAAEKKKTDEATEDVEEEKNEVEAEPEPEPEPEANDDDAEKNSEPDSEEDNETVEEVESVSENKGAGEGTRKRKVRKE